MHPNLLFFYIIKCYNSNTPNDTQKSSNICQLQAESNVTIDIPLFKTREHEFFIDIVDLINNLSLRMKDKLLARSTINNNDFITPFYVENLNFTKEDEILNVVDNLLIRFDDIFENFDKGLFCIVNCCLESKIRYSKNHKNNLFLKLQILKFYVFINTEFENSFEKTHINISITTKEQIKFNLTQLYSSFNTEIIKICKKFEHVISKTRNQFQLYLADTRSNSVRLYLEKIKILIDSNEFFMSDTLSDLILKITKSDNVTLLIEVLNISFVLYYRNNFDNDLSESIPYKASLTDTAKNYFNLDNFCFLTIFYYKRDVTEYKYILNYLKMFKIYFVKSYFPMSKISESFDCFYENFMIEMSKKIL